MKPIQKCITLLHWFSLGLLSPVLSLLLLARGANLRNLPLILAVYSAVVLLAEVPSGIFADLKGRRLTFLLSCAFYAASLLLLLAASSALLLLPVMVFYGLGRSFSTGSLDALFIEDAVARGGEAALSRAAGTLSLCQSIGLASGALVGGLLPDWRGYAPHLLVRLGVILVLALVCMAAVPRDGGRDRRPAPALRAHLRQSAALLRQRPPLAGLLLSLLASGFLINMVDTYWQPDFIALGGARLRPLLGLISVLGFCAVTLGNLLIQRLRLPPGKREWAAYLAVRLLLAAVTALFAAHSGLPGFIGGYAAIYFILGGSDVLEQTLIHRMLPDSQRASLLSLASFAAQTGGLLACFVAGWAANRAGWGEGAFGPLYLCGAAAVLGCAALLALLKRPRPETEDFT